MAKARTIDVLQAWQVPVASKGTLTASCTQQGLLRLRLERGKPSARGRPSHGLRAARAARAASPSPSSSSSSSSPTPANNGAPMEDNDSGSEQDSGVRQWPARMRGPLRRQRSPRQVQDSPALPDDAPRQEESPEDPEEPRPLPGFLRQTSSLSASQTVSRPAGAPSAQHVTHAAPVPYTEPEATQRALLLAESIARSSPAVKPAVGSSRQPRDVPLSSRPGTTPGATSAATTHGSRMAIDAPTRRSGLTSNGVPVSIAEKYKCRYRAEETDVDAPRMSRRVPRTL